MHLDHIVLNVIDVERMLSFYVGVLGMAPERVDAFRAGNVPFPSVRIDPATVIDLFPLALWRREGAATGTPNLNHLCLALPRSDWNALCARLDGARVPVNDGPGPRWGARGTGTSIYFDDPEGNRVEARYYDVDAPTGDCLLAS
ncbi:MAG: VOC family protein [Gammaproteobacteria bacterium]|nr:VOC family protein [Gammaproteobacteria bacterium]